MRSTSRVSISKDWTWSRVGCKLFLFMPGGKKKKQLLGVSVSETPTGVCWHF